jgi:ketosteroid isomerase-like protein
VEVEQNKAVVRRFLDEVGGRGAFDVASELCTEDCVNHAAVPLRQRGIQNIKAVVEFSRSAQPDQRWVERQIIGDGDLVVVHGRREGTWQADSFRGTDTPVNRPVSVELAHMFRLRDGKIAEQWTVRDDLGMQQLGVI